MGTQNMPKELGLFHVNLLTATLYILWEKFFTVQATHKTYHHWESLNFMMVFKRLHHNHLKIVTLWILKAIIGGKICDI